MNKVKKKTLKETCNRKPQARRPSVIEQQVCVCLCVCVTALGVGHTPH